MENTQNMREEHNRQIQADIDLERTEIKRCQRDKNEFSPRIQNLTWELDQIDISVRRIDIEMEAREKKILVLQDRFWKD